LTESPRYVQIRLLLPLSLVLLVTVCGTLGYHWLGRAQGATWLDALFMTVTTITTIGYGEIIHLDSYGRIFTIVVAVTGICSVFYSMTVVMENLIGSQLVDPFGEKRMQREIDKLKDHIIIAGLGRVGRQAVAELQEAQIPCVVVDPGKEAMHHAHQHNHLLITGDATDDSVLEAAGIMRANGLIVTTGDDASNLYIVLSARVLNPQLYIVSRAVDDVSIPKLTRAGANRAISPYAIGGRRLAHLILNPTVVDFFDTVIRKGGETFNLEGIKVHSAAKAVGQSLASLNVRQRTGASVLVILRGNRVLPNPDPDIILHAGDELLALGTMAQLESLENLIAG
jgi:voltage-gated potassium channel